MTKTSLIAIIDDDEAMRISLGQMLRLRGFQVKLFESAITFLDSAPIKSFSCIITDIKMSDVNGEELLSHLGEQIEKVPTIIITAHGDVAMAVRCLKKGAYDFLEKPFEDDILVATVKRALEKHELYHEAAKLREQITKYESSFPGKYGIIGQSSAIEQVFEGINTSAQTDYPVLILGETGTGKELVARAIHDHSPRKNMPFIALNAGAFSESMIESELFGHIRGAYTGADYKREGKLLAANGGTLLLDEVESIPLSVQVKLLRTLEDGLVYPLGKDEPVKTNFRLIISTNVDLKELVTLGKIRHDFYHRLMVLNINIPPLRKRKEDIPLLLAYFIRMSAKHNSISPPKISEKVLNQMIVYDWSGNVRELKHTVERMVITARNGELQSFDGTPIELDRRLLSIPETDGKLHDVLEKAEKKCIIQTLKECKGEVSLSATALGISRRALYERMKKYDLNKMDFRY